MSIALISVHAYQVNVIFFSHSYIFRKVTFGCLCEMGGLVWFFGGSEGEGREKGNTLRFFLAEVTRATDSVGLAFFLKKSAVTKNLFLSPLARRTERMQLLPVF